MDSIRVFLSKHEVATFWSSVMVALLILLPIIGWEHMWSNLLSFYNGDNAGEKFISVWITGFVLMLMSILREGNWKTNASEYKGVVALFLAFYMYHYTKDDLAINATHDNWFTTITTTVSGMIEWVTARLPDWFFADGWLYLWFIVRKIIKYAIILSLLYILPSVVLSLPVKWIYDAIHAPKDQPSNLFELLGPLVFFPPYFYAVLWISYNSPFYDRWYIRLVFLIIACVVIAFACIRKRCPQCGCSSLTTLQSNSNRQSAVYTGSTKTWKESGSGLFKEKWDEKTTDHYKQDTVHSSLYKCNRCKHEWWESFTTTRHFDR